MAKINVYGSDCLPDFQRSVEIVERKGAGHPDTMCDGMMEAVSLALCREYLDRFGKVLHHNTDKALLVAGKAETRPGGGRIVDPMRLVMGDRATAEYQGERIDVHGIAKEAASAWLRDHLRFVDPDKHVVFQSELKPGSAELTDIFERDVMVANDTSAAVGFAPLTESERLVLETEEFLNSSAFKQEFPEAGEDVKVMGVRRGRVLSLTVAVAMVDRFVSSAQGYFERKLAMTERLRRHLEPMLQELDSLDLTLNSLDDPDRGASGMYLSVLGTSAESADCGQVGRGNGVSGLIPLNRPSGSEAAAGKNPVSHVGKIYSLLSQRIAETIHADVDGVEAATVRLCSRIGRPIGEPQAAAAELVMGRGVSIFDVETPVREIVESELSAIHDFTASLSRGEMKVW